MSALAVSCLMLVLTLGGILVGALLRRALPKHHPSKDSQDVVRGVGLIATMAALVLGLLIAAARSSFETQSTQVTQITADIILLDNLLARYGPEGRPIPEKCAVSSAH
jgi:acyl carrier protein phosphodiesterase